LLLRLSSSFSHDNALLSCLPLPFTISIIFSIVSWYCIDLGSIFVFYVYRNKYRYWYCVYYSWYCIDYGSSLIFLFLYVFRFWFRMSSFMYFGFGSVGLDVLVLCPVYLGTVSGVFIFGCLCFVIRSRSIELDSQSYD